MSIRIVNRDGISEHTIASAERVGDALLSTGQGEYDVLANVHATLEDEIEVPVRKLALQPPELAPVVGEWVVARRRFGPSKIRIDEFVDEVRTVQQRTRERVCQHRCPGIREDLPQAGQ